MQCLEKVTENIAPDRVWSKNDHRKSTLESEVMLRYVSRKAASSEWQFRTEANVGGAPGVGAI